MKRLLPFALTLFLVGCGSKDAIPYLGRWHGDLVVDKTDRAGTDKDLQRESLRGALQIYATDKRCKLHLEGEQETIDAEGNWSHTGTTVTIKFTSVKIDDQGGADRRDPNLKFIAPVDIRAAYQRNLILHLSRDKKKLLGLEVTLGHLTGHHVFTRSSD